MNKLVEIVNKLRSLSQGLRSLFMSYSNVMGFKYKVIFLFLKAALLTSMLRMVPHDLKESKGWRDENHAMTRVYKKRFLE